MKFKMNNRTYEIKEVSQEDLRQEIGEIEGDYFGLTLPKNQEIWLWQELNNEQKRITLIHELSHCYMFNHITFNKTNFSEDDWADITANSHDIIHKIVEEYFGNKVKIDISCDESSIAKVVNKESEVHITRI